MTDESVFAAALAIPRPGDRAAYLNKACSGNPALRREVEALLSAHAADNPLDRPLADLAVTGDYDATDKGSPAAEVGDWIGPYRLMEQIGEGGFGLVFVAEQAEPVRRKVALKVLKPGMDTRDVVARFEAERQALALMDHPNIARVLDAGSTPAGRPYFVMELVRGVPITDFCDAHKLTPRERLALFVQVCQAVQHAHQKGVIHRDIKPSNVLVTMLDGAPVPKVIDFGVAKAVGQSLTDKTVYTRFAQILGTPLYMSPEQAEMSAVDVDTRTDVYALGVLLYELLTGSTPFDRDRFRKAAFDEIRRIIREEEPPRPSTRLSSLGSTLTDISVRRGTDPGKLTGLVRGELDWIVMKSLEKDRNRRYETASGLARDVERFLGGDAVEACPPTFGYRLRKLYRRNRAAAWIAAVFLLLTYVGASGIYFAYHRAIRAEKLAAVERDAALISRARAEVASREAAAERDNAERANWSLRELAVEQRRTLYVSAMNLAQTAWEGAEPRRTFEFLRPWAPKPGEDDLRGFEWHYWNRLAHLDLKTVRLAGFEKASHQPPVLSPDGTKAFGFTPDPAGVASRCTIWDAATGRELWSVPAPEGATFLTFACFSQDGRRFAASWTIGNVSSLPTVVRLLDTATGKTLYSLDSRDGARWILAALSPDGFRLALVARADETSDVREAFEVRQLPEGKEIFRRPSTSPGHHAGQADFSPDGTRILTTERTGSGALTLRVHELGSGRQVWEARPPERLLLWTFRFNPDGSRILYRVLSSESTDRIVVLDAADGRELQTLRLPLPTGFRFLPVHASMYTRDLEMDGSRLAVTQGEQATLIDLGHVDGFSIGPSQGATVPTRAFRGHEDVICGTAFGRDGSRFVSIDKGGTVKHWDLAARESRLANRFDVRASGSPFPNSDGSRLAVVPAQGVEPVQKFRILDGSSRALFEEALMPGHADDACFSADGRTLAVIWHDAKTLQFAVVVWDAISGRELLRRTTARGSTVSVSLTPDGSRVAIAITVRPVQFVRNNAIVQAWDVATGRELLTRSETTTTDRFRVIYSPDGRRIVINPARHDDGDRRIVWFDTETGAEAPTLKLGPRPVAGLAFRRDGRRLAVAQLDGTSTIVRVWDVEPVLRGESPQLVLTLTGLVGNRPRVEFSPDGKRLLTSGDATVKLWDAATGREVLTLKANGVPTGDAYFSSDGRKIWGGLDDEGRIWGWDAVPIDEARMP